MNDKPSSPRTSAAPGPTLTPLSDDEAQAQLTQLGKAIVSAAQLQNVDAGFAFSSCNDQGDPPHQGSLEIGFTVPSGQSPDAYLNQVAAHMTSLGWVDGAPPGKTYVGKVLSMGGIAAQLRPPTVNDPKAVISIDGECRNMTDHKTDGKGNGHDVTAEVTS
ncbi:hypothetical protein [Mycobacterium sp. SA01]|uniref:hypothetical protein n=1 Tax=Mycobacterium sp. SA01 TaxID=3238820 RepID=UPI00351B1C22